MGWWSRGARFPSSLKTTLSLPMVVMREILEPSTLPIYIQKAYNTFPVHWSMWSENKNFNNYYDNNNSFGPNLMIIWVFLHEFWRRPITVSLGPEKFDVSCDWSGEDFPPGILNFLKDTAVLDITAGDLCGGFC